MHGVVLQNCVFEPRPTRSGEARLSRACPSRPRCRPCGWRSPIRCRTRPGRARSVPSITWVCVEVEGRARRVVVEVERDQRLVVDGEDALERAVAARRRLMIASLTSSTVVGRFGTNLKSISETFGVGTRIEVPSSLPFSSGSTRPTAFAAPVEVGIIEQRGGARAVADPCAACPAPAGRRCRRGSSSCSRARCRSRCAARRRPAPGSWWCRRRWRRWCGSSSACRG